MSSFLHHSVWFRTRLTLESVSEKSPNLQKNRLIPCFSTTVFPYFFCLLLASIDYIVYHSSGLHPSCTIPTKQTKRSHLLWAETDCYLCGSQDFCCCGVHLALTEQIVTFHITQEVATFCMVRGGQPAASPHHKQGGQRQTEGDPWKRLTSLICIKLHSTEFCVAMLTKLKL